MSKFLDTISNSYKKLFKGFAMLITIQLLVLGIFSIIQSCQDDEPHIKERIAESNAKFLSSVQKASFNLSKVQFRQQNTSILEKGGSPGTVECATTEEVCYTSYDGSLPTPIETINEIVGYQHPYLGDENGNPIEDSEYLCIEACPEDVKNALYRQ